jgi:hypothetical protein
MVVDVGHFVTAFLEKSASSYPSYICAFLDDSDKSLHLSEPQILSAEQDIWSKWSLVPYDSFIHSTVIFIEYPRVPTSLLPFC